MTIEYTYIADDGEEFDSEEECLAYEKAAKERFNSVIFFNENKEIIENPTLDEIESEAFFFYPTDEKKMHAVIDWLNYQLGMGWNEMMDPIVANHFYGYSTKLEGWFDLTKFNEELTNKIGILDAAIKKMRFGK